MHAPEVISRPPPPLTSPATNRTRAWKPTEEDAGWWCDEMVQALFVKTDSEAVLVQNIVDMLPITFRAMLHLPRFDPNLDELHAELAAWEPTWRAVFSQFRRSSTSTLSSFDPITASPAATDTFSSEPIPLRSAITTTLIPEAVPSPAARSQASGSAHDQEDQAARDARSNASTPIYPPFGSTPGSTPPCDGFIPVCASVQGTHLSDSSRSPSPAAPIATSSGTSTISSGMMRVLDPVSLSSEYSSSIPASSTPPAPNSTAHVDQESEDHARQSSTEEDRDIDAVPPPGPVVAPRPETIGAGASTAAAEFTPRIATSVSSSGLDGRRPPSDTGVDINAAAAKISAPKVTSVSTSGLTSGLSKPGDHTPFSSPASGLATSCDTSAALCADLSQAQDTPAFHVDARPGADASAQRSVTSDSVIAVSKATGCNRSRVKACSAQKPPHTLDSAGIAIQRMRSAWMMARRSAQYVRKSRSVDIALRRLRAAFDQLSDKPMSNCLAIPSPSILQDRLSLSGPSIAPIVGESLIRAPASASLHTTTVASKEPPHRPRTFRPTILPSRSLQSLPAYFFESLHAPHHVLDTIAFRFLDFLHAYSYTSSYKPQLPLHSHAPYFAALSPLHFR